MSVPLDRQIKAVRRELGMRKSVYPRQVAQGRMTETEARRMVEEMQAVLDTLETLAGPPAQASLLPKETT